MKVATLNFHNAYNYGAVFQSAALQHIVQCLGYDCDIIDYRNERVEAQYLLKKITINKRVVNDIRSNIVLLPFIKRKKENFHGWFSKYKKTKNMKRDELSSLNDIYDKFIVGSDQVWNMKCHDSDTSYYLDFVQDDNRKIAYAPSFGTYNLNHNDRKLAEKYIPLFPYLSAREERGNEIIKELCGRDSVCTMDPVLLVNMDYWIEKAGKRLLKDNYIFVYQLGHGNLIPKFVHALKNRMQLQIVYVTGHIGNMIYYHLGEKNYSTASPEEFLSLIINSEYVVTNSFHATVLSIQFQKQFSVVVEGDNKASYNSRIFGLLERYGMSSRAVNKYSDDQLTELIEYDGVEERIELDRKKSINYLQMSIGS